MPVGRVRVEGGEQAVEWGVELREWTPTLTYCSNGPAGPVSHDGTPWLLPNIAVE